MTDPVGGGARPADPRARLLEASRQLEAVFFQQMLQAMRQAAPVEGGPLTVSAGEQMFQGLFDEALAGLAASQSERGIGMAMYRQLSRHLPPEEAGTPAPSGNLEHRNGVGR